jgi:glutathione synthase/RimK-type ligase-like ATP-grasp enzyme
MKYNVAILKSEASFEHELWLNACEENPLVESADIIELTADNWYSLVINKNYDIFLLRPSGRSELFKRLYDERAYIISLVLNKKVYPSYNELFIYENKRVLRDWMLANGIPHPKTYIFFNKKEALNFITGFESYPIVAKTNIGASGSGIDFLRTKNDARVYISGAFSGGISRSSGPKLLKGSLLAKTKKVLFKKGFLKNRLKEYAITSDQKQKDFIIFQEFVPHIFEWRCVRIGDAYFAHKKIAINNKSSGTLIKGYDPVPEKLLDFIRNITNRTKIHSVAIDVFEKDDSYLVNEIQCFFGQSDPHQMLVDGKPGKYCFVNNKWIFKAGDFNKNESYNLRLEHALGQLKKS